MKFLGISIEATFTNIFRLLSHILLVGFCSFFLTWSLRHYLLPTSINLNLPLNFVFQTCPDGGVCSFPVANVSVLTSNGAPFFEPGIPYRITLNLLFPDTPINRDLGMFLTVLNFHPREGIVSGSIVRSAVLPYRSLLVRMFKNLFTMPFLMFRFSEEKEPLSIELDNRYFENVFQPTTALSVQLQHKSIQVQSGSLNLSASFGFVRSFLFNWPIFSSIILFLMWGSLFAGTMALYWTQKSASFVWRIVGKLEAIGNESNAKLSKIGPPKKSLKIKKEKPLPLLSDTPRIGRRLRPNELAEQILNSHPDPSLFDERLPAGIDINCNDEAFQSPMFMTSRKRFGSSPELRKRNIARAFS